MASIHCKCGEVQIKFTSQTPVVAVECCDKLAFNNIKFLAYMGKYEFPNKFPVLVYYFENKLVVVKGIEKLTFNKVIEESNMVNMCTTCCHTFLSSQNLTFAQSSVMVHGDRSRLTNIFHQPPILRFFGNQLSTEEREQLVHIIPDMNRDAKNRMSGDRDGWEEIYSEFLRLVSAPISEDREGLSFEEIFERVGEPVLVFGWQSTRFSRKTVAHNECVLRN
jgi:hypothetical protein